MVEHFHGKEGVTSSILVLGSIRKEIIMATSKKLTLGTNKKLSGVCAGIAEYFDFDVTIIRLAMLFFILVTGIFPGLIFYIIAAIVMPEKKEGK